MHLMLLVLGYLFTRSVNSNNLSTSILYLNLIENARFMTNYGPTE